MVVSGFENIIIGVEEDETNEKAIVDTTQMEVTRNMRKGNRYCFHLDCNWTPWRFCLVTVFPTSIGEIVKILRTMVDLPNISALLCGSDEQVAIQMARGDLQSAPVIHQLEPAMGRRGQGAMRSSFPVITRIKERCDV